MDDGAFSVEIVLSSGASIDVELGLREFQALQNDFAKEEPFGMYRTTHGSLYLRMSQVAALRAVRVCAVDTVHGTAGARR